MEMLLFIMWYHAWVRVRLSQYTCKNSQTANDCYNPATWIVMSLNEIDIRLIFLLEKSKEVAKMHKLV